MHVEFQKHTVHHAVDQSTGVPCYMGYMGIKSRKLYVLFGLLAGVSQQSHQEGNRRGW